MITVDEKKVLVTGGKGLVGSALKKMLPNAIYISSGDCDLRNPEEVQHLLSQHEPKHVIHLAAMVGGVKGNTRYIANFYTDNILINTNVLKFAYMYRVQRVISLLSTCVYPDSNYAKYPLTEDQLHLGPPHDSNFGYAYAKRMLEVQSRAYRQQYGCDFVCAIPNNIWGPMDNFDLENSHVIPALIRKIWEAKLFAKPDVILWGDGSPLREFTYSKDVTRAILFLLMEDYEYDGPVNIGNTQEYSIRQVAEKIAKIFEYDGEIFWDTSMPSGQHRKPSSNQKFRNLGFKSTYTDFDRALKETCLWFKENYPRVRGM